MTTMALNRHLLAIFLLWLYPLQGKYLKEIKKTLRNKTETINNQ